MISPTAVKCPNCLQEVLILIEAEQVGEYYCQHCCKNFIAECNIYVRRITDKERAERD